MLKAALGALLEPTQLLKDAEQKRPHLKADSYGEFRGLPVSAVWNKYCLDKGVPAGSGWMEDVRKYEKDTLSKRD